MPVRFKVARYNGLAVDADIDRRGRPVELFEGRYQMGDVQASPNTDYDYDPDAERFVMVRDVGDPADETRIRVVFGWLDELERLAPPGDDVRRVK